MPRRSVGLPSPSATPVPASATVADSKHEESTTSEMPPRNGGKFWNQEDRDYLEAERERRVPYRQIGKMLGRSERACRKEMYEGKKERGEEADAVAATQLLANTHTGEPLVESPAPVKEKGKREVDAATMAVAATQLLAATNTSEPLVESPAPVKKKGKEKVDPETMAVAATQLLVATNTSEPLVESPAPVKKKGKKNVDPETTAAARILVAFSRRAWAIDTACGIVQDSMTIGEAGHEDCRLSPSLSFR